MVESRLLKSTKIPTFVMHIPELWVAEKLMPPLPGEIEVNIQVLVNGVLYQAKDSLKGKITGRDGWSKEYKLEKVA